MKPITLNDDDRYRSMSVNLMSLQNQRTELAADVSRMAQTAATTPTGSALVVGIDQPSTPPDMGELVDTKRRLREVDAAIVLQSRLLDIEKTLASQRLCGTLVGNYRNRVAGVLAAAETFAAAVAAERQFVRFHQANGLELTGHVAPIPVDPSNFGPSSILSRFISQLAERIAQIPADALEPETKPINTSIDLPSTSNHPPARRRGGR